MKNEQPILGHEHRRIDRMATAFFLVAALLFIIAIGSLFVSCDPIPQLPSFK